MVPGAEQETFLSYNGEVLVFQLSKSKAAESGAHKTMSTLHCRRMVFDTDSGQFSQKGTGQYYFPGANSRVQFICCRCTVDSRTGMTLPCILMRKRTKRDSGSKYFLLLLHTPNNFECCLKFQLDYEMTADIQLCEGPTVLWKHERALFYISSKTGTVLSAPVEFSSIKWAGQSVEEDFVVVGVKHSNVSEAGDGQSISVSDGAIWGSEFIGYALEKQQTVPGTCFLPHGYSCVVTCMHVYVTEEDDSQLRTNVVAATSKKQLVWFQDGVPQDVCQLPFEEPSAIQLASTGRGDLVFVVFFASCAACAVWKDSFQVASSWQGVKSVLVDDFIGTGAEQMLVLFEDISSNLDCLSTFQITDFGAVNYVSDISNSKEDLVADGGLENRFRTVQALEMRLQAGMACVHELQQHLQLKDRVLSESCAALMDLVQGKEHAMPSALEEGLVSLWDDQENTCLPSDKMNEMPSQDAQHPVERVWHRLVDDSWVVGVKLIDSVNLSLSDVSLSLLMDQGFNSIAPVTVCHSDVLRLTKLTSELPISARQMEPLPKRVKLGHQGRKGLESDYSERPPSEIHSDWARTVTAVTDLSPLLAFCNVTCVVLLHARRKKNLKGCSVNSKRLTLTCGRISLGLEDVSKGKHSANLSWGHCTAPSMVEDLFAVLTALHRFTFQINSPDCTLTPVNSWLLRQMKCEPVKECPDYLLCKGPGGLHDILFNWKLQRPCEGTLTVFCRNQAALFQCLHGLIGILPPSCVVKSLMLGSKPCYTDSFAQSLEKEMLTHRRSITSLINEVEKELALRSKAEKKFSSVLLASVASTKDAVQQYRDELQSEQALSRAAVNLTMSSALYRDITLKIARVQLNTDRLAQKLSYL